MPAVIALKSRSGAKQIREFTFINDNEAQQELSQCVPHSHLVRRDRQAAHCDLALVPVLALALAVVQVPQRPDLVLAGSHQVDVVLPNTGLHGLGEKEGKRVWDSIRLSLRAAASGGHQVHIVQWYELTVTEHC